MPTFSFPRFFCHDNFLKCVVVWSFSCCSHSFGMQSWGLLKWYSTNTPSQRSIVWNIAEHYTFPLHLSLQISVSQTRQSLGQLQFQPFPKTHIFGSSEHTCTSSAVIFLLQVSCIGCSCIVLILQILMWPDGLKILWLNVELVELTLYQVPGWRQLRSRVGWLTGLCPFSLQRRKCQWFTSRTLFGLKSLNRMWAPLVHDENMCTGAGLHLGGTTTSLFYCT